MTSELDGDLLRQAEIYVKSGEFDIARRYLERVLDLGGDLQTLVLANYYMSLASKDPVEKRKYLEEALALDPLHPEARRYLAILDGKLKPEEVVNADQLPASSSAPQEAQADRFTCPKCGGKMVYAPDGQSLMCESCARREALTGQAPQQEQDFFLAMATGKGQRKPTATQILHCQGCGAQFLLAPAALSESCPYCGSAHVIHETKDLIEPDSILPMSFSQQEAAARLTQWMKRQGIEGTTEVPAPRGFYLPLWSFDLMGEVPWTAKMRRERSLVPVSGSQSIAINHLLVPASAKLAELLPKIAPDIDLSEAKAYDPRYLAGWAAEVYEREMAEASLDARQSALGRIRETILASSGNLEDLSYSTANVFVSAFQLTLVPLWLAEFPREGKTWRVVISGKSGNVHSQSPTHGALGWLEAVLGTK